MSSKVKSNSSAVSNKQTLGKRAKSKRTSIGKSKQSRPKGKDFKRQSKGHS